jgi:hypothetical protein
MMMNKINLLDYTTATTGRDYALDIEILAAIASCMRDYANATNAVFTYVDDTNYTLAYPQYSNLTYRIAAVKNGNNWTISGYQKIADSIEYQYVVGNILYYSSNSLWQFNTGVTATSIYMYYYVGNFVYLAPQILSQSSASSTAGLAIARFIRIRARTPNGVIIPNKYIDINYTGTVQYTIAIDGRILVATSSLFAGQTYQIMSSIGTDKSGNLLLVYSPISLLYDNTPIMCAMNLAYFNTNIFEGQEDYHLIESNIGTCAAMAFSLNSSPQIACLFVP